MTSRSATHQRGLMEGRGPLGASVYVPPAPVHEWDWEVLPVSSSDLDCARCHGDTTVGYNPGVGIRNPQLDVDITCPGCGGTGSEADRLEREENL